jgi:hypothetical protein
MNNLIVISKDEIYDSLSFRDNILEDITKLFKLF